MGMGPIQGAINQALGAAAAGAGIVQAGKNLTIKENISDISSSVKKSNISSNLRGAYAKQVGKQNQFARKNFDADIMKKSIQNVAEEIAAKQTLKENFKKGLENIIYQGGAK